MPTLRIYAGFDMVYDRQYPAIKGVLPSEEQKLIGYKNPPNGYLPKTLYCFSAVGAASHAELQGKQLLSISAYLRFTTVANEKATNTHIFQKSFLANDNGDTSYEKCGDNKHALAAVGYSNMRTEGGNAAQIKNMLLYGLAVSSPQFSYNESLYSSVKTAIASTANKPYFEVEYTSPILSAKDCVPATGFINEKQANTFSWAVEYDAERVLGTAKQKAVSFQWRAKGESSFNTINGGTQPNITVQANTFTVNEVEWRIILFSDDGTAGTPSEWYTLTTVDSLSTPLALYPKSLPIDGTRPITFTWRHDIETGTAQAKYDLQYSADSGTNWQALASESTSRQSYTVPANRFTAGTLLWRVRTYNSDGIAGGWSVPASFVLRAAPSVSITGYNTKPRPTIRWQAQGQQGYRIKAGGYDSGILYGVMKAFQIPVYLPNGKTTVSLSVRNSFGMDSPYSSAEITIVNSPSAAITLTTRELPNGARLSWSTTGAYVKYYVYRDNILIAKANGTGYTDWLTNGKHKYYVRGVTEDDYYTLSNEAVEFTVCRFAVIAEYNTPSIWLPLRLRRAAPRTHEVTREQAVIYQYYSGRTLPIGETNGNQSGVHTITVTFRNRTEAQRLEGLLGKTVIYKDSYGDIAVGILGACSAAYDNCADFSFTITEVSAEGVFYDD